MNFVHIRFHTDYSIEKSISRIEDIIKKVKSDKQKCLCITDTGNLSNMLRFYKKCIDNKIKPIVGCDLTLKHKRNNYNIILILKNKLGYINLSRILSRSATYNKNFIDYCWLRGELRKNLILILNLNNSLKNFNKRYKKTKKFIKDLYSIFKKDLYLEIQKNNKKIYREILNISNYFHIPLIGTNPIYFNNKEDFIAYKAKIFIFNKKKNNIYCKNNYFYNKKDIKKTFKDDFSSLKNTFRLSKKCNFNINFNKIKLPFFKLKSNKNVNFYIFKTLLKKLKINNLYLNLSYKKRLINEVKIIIEMKLADYFLIVEDFIKWSKKKNIQVGPGRGSSAGSLVSFLLNITEIDPIKYNLIFERFLNKNRQSIPDFDIDFCQHEREKVIKYIKKKYGLGNICHIVTFNKMASKNSLKDVGKFLNFNYDFINEISKIISLSKKYDNLSDILKYNNELNNFYRKNKKVKELIDLSIKLEGITKNFGIHAGGIIISSNKIFFHVPIWVQNNLIISQYYKDDIESLGILKFDFLGLSTLSIIKDCLQNIKSKILLKNINLKDKNCYKNLRMGNTIGVFQLESEGIRNFLKKIKPDCFENIIAIISLYRPGPINLIDDFCMKKFKKKKIVYIDNRLKNILKETYGIIVYQEQIIKIVEIIANYNLNEADIFRILISKKKKDEMFNQEKTFIENSLKNGLDIKKSKLIFNLIKKFADYGFNKSHATAYSLLSYYTNWFKVYYNEYLMASNMSHYFRDSEKLHLLIKDSIKNNIKILPININLSDNDFKVLNNKFFKKIRYGFKGVVGLGENNINHIINIRKNGIFKNFIDFYKRVDKCLINYKTIEILITSGCFDSINNNRAFLIKLLKLISKTSIKKLNFKKNFLKKIYFKKNFFWKFKTKILEEKSSLGFFFLNNLYNIYKKSHNWNINFNNLKKGIIVKIQEKSINDYFSILIFDEHNNKFKIKIKKNLFIKNINNIKIYNYIEILYNKIYKNIIIANEIINFKKNVKN